jgi:hypothetical protein
MEPAATGSSGWRHRFVGAVRVRHFVQFDHQWGQYPVEQDKKQAQRRSETLEIARWSAFEAQLDLSAQISQAFPLGSRLTPKIEMFHVVPFATS